MINLVKIAHVGSTQGKLGALKLYPKEKLEEELLQSEFVFFRIGGSKVPFQVKSINSDNEPWLLYLSNIINPESATELSNSDLYIESANVKESLHLDDKGLIGYNILSSDNIKFGTIIEVEEHPHQILFLIEHNNSEFRIPFHPDLIITIDSENQNIIFRYTESDFLMLI